MGIFERILVEDPCEDPCQGSLHRYLSKILVEDPCISFYTSKDPHQPERRLAGIQIYFDKFFLYNKLGKEYFLTFNAKIKFEGHDFDGMPTAYCRVCQQETHAPICSVISRKLHSTQTQARPTTRITPRGQ